MTSDTHAAGPADQGEWLQTRPGERCLIRVAAAETNGAYSVVEILSQPGDSTSMHVHQNEDEHFLILEGTARVVRGGAAVTNGALRLLARCWRGGCEEALRVIARGGDVDIDALAKKFGISVVGPPLLGG